jgi:hypothetical protein
MDFNTVDIKFTSVNYNYYLGISCLHFTDNRKYTLGGRCVISDRQFIHVIDFKNLD